jgi:hypothetical protein
VPTAGTVADHTYAFGFRVMLGPVSPAAAGDFVYQLAFLERGRIPVDTGYRARDHELARVRTTYHGQGAPGLAVRADYARFPVPAGLGIYTAAFLYPLPAKRIEFYTANPDITWDHLLSVGPTDLSDSELSISRRSYRPGDYDAGWSRAPLGPAFGLPYDGFGVTRNGTELQVALVVLSGSDPHQVTVPPAAMTGVTTLSKDGNEIGTSPVPGFATFTVPDGPGTYTLRVTADRAVPWSVVGTHADVAWTFRDAVPAGTPLPLLVVRAIGAVDEQSRAPAGRPFPLLLKAQHQPDQPAVRLGSLRVEASYDDGLTWTVVPTISGGDTGLALLRHPAAPGFVSLRIVAQDTEGNSVSQTVLRAYQTRA